MGANDWRRDKWIKGLERADWNGFLTYTQRLLSDLGLDEQDERYALNVRNDSDHRMSLVLRDRLTFVLSVDGGPHLVIMLAHDALDRLQGVPFAIDTRYEPFAGNPKARLYKLALEDMAQHMERIYPEMLAACKALLKVTGKKTRYRMHHITDIGRMVFDPEFREQAMNYVLEEKGEWPGEATGKHRPLSMEQNNARPLVGPNVPIFKLGCMWGSGKPDFYDMIKGHSIIITVPDFLASVGSLIVVTSGHRVRAIAQVLTDPVPVTQRTDLRSDFNKFQIDYNANVLVAEVNWFELPPKWEYQYNLQQGIVKVQDKLIRKMTIDRWNDTVDLASAPVPKYESNIILYGPPGTGKTYNSACYAVAIVEGVEPEEIMLECETKEDRSALMGRYWDYVESGLIGFVTFHQSFSYEDFIEGIKPVLNDQGGDGNVHYEIKDGVFKTICNAALDNWLGANQVVSKVSAFDDVFQRFMDSWEEDPTIKIAMRTAGYDYTITGFTDRSIHFRKASGGEQHTLSKNTLREIYYGRREPKISGVGVYYPGLIARLKELSNDSKEPIKLRRYVLVIDEINRGNVSGIFGELITLLEQDKRMGSIESIRVKLPYSKDLFAVPQNVYVIGTMNTADRSVEALDTALRRRFSFVEMQFDAERIEQPEGFEVELAKLATAINGRLERLLDKDHKIGHSYFMGIINADDPEVELRKVFKNKVLPLLEEYFYGDARKLGAVLGASWVEKQPANSSKLFSGFEVEDATKEVYEISDPDKASIKAYQSIYE